LNTHDFVQLIFIARPKFLNLHREQLYLDFNLTYTKWEATNKQLQWNFFQRIKSHF